MYKAITHGIEVQVLTQFLDEHSEPRDNMFVWAYEIKIINLGVKQIQLMSRYWKITNADGSVEVIEGEGVIGKQPVLKSGEQFNYQSAAPLDTASGIMAGHYVAESHENGLFHVTIPTFSLDSPYEARPYH